MLTPITPGMYRTRSKGLVLIMGPHPRFPSIVVADDYCPDKNPNAKWWKSDGANCYAPMHDLVWPVELEELIAELAPALNPAHGTDAAHSSTLEAKT